MSAPKDIQQGKTSNHASPASSVSPSTSGVFLVPSPVPTRRTRTKSMSELALEGPTHKGIVKEFCRQRGHGFISPEDNPSSKIFVHISDIEEEWVPIEGDHVTYKTIHIPPKMEKLQAVHVHITHLKPGVLHERWDS